LVVESLLQKKKRRERKEAEGGGLISWLRLSLDGGVGHGGLPREPSTSPA
jgi:hypothetical protein